MSENINNKSESELNGREKSNSKKIPHRGQSKKDEEKMKEQSIEEKVMQQKISGVESLQLQRVFGILCGMRDGDNQSQVTNQQSQQGGQQSNPNLEYNPAFSGQDLITMCNQLEFQTTKYEIDLMVWEVDEDLDKNIDWHEFQLMYKRCIFDNSGLEPRRLFTLVEFLMFDKNERNFITIEDTLELLYVKASTYKKTELNEEIKTLFPADQKELLQMGEEQKLTFTEFYQKMMQKALDDHKRRQQEKLNVRKYPSKEEQ